MLLSEISSQSSAGVIHQVNRYLLECYQCVINTQTPTSTLKQLDRNLSKTIMEMRMDGATPEHSDYARVTMVQQALKNLLAQRALTESMSQPHNSVFDRVCASLYQSACDCVNVGDSIDHALHKVMDVYRSSRYRFPDQQVEDRVYEMLCDAFDQPRHANTTLLDAEVFEQEDKLDRAELQNRIHQNLENNHSAEIQDIDSEELEKQIRRVANIHKDIPSSQLTDKLLDELAMQVLNKLTPVEVEQPKPANPLRDRVDQVRELFADQSEEIQEIAEAMLRRMRLMYPEVFTQHSAQDISKEIIIVAGFEAPAEELTKTVVDPWVNGVVRDLEQSASVQEKYSKRRKS